MVYLSESFVEYIDKFIGINDNEVWKFFVVRVCFSMMIFGMKCLRKLRE